MPGDHQESSNLPALNPTYPFTRFCLVAIFAFLAISTSACNSAGGAGASDFAISTYQSGGVLEGGDTSLQAVLDQGRPVVLNFWAGDCPPCRAEMPTLEDAWDEFKGEVVVLGVDIGPFFGLGTFEQGVALMEEMEVTYPAGNSVSATVLEDYNLNSLPATYFLLPDGSIEDSWRGAISSGPLHRRITDLVDAHREQAG